MNTNVNQNEQSAQTQCALILAHLKRGEKITSMEALEKYRCFRLASRISDPKRQGYAIVKEMILTNTGKHVAQYHMEGGSNE